MTAPKILLDVCEFIVDCEHKTAPLSATGYPSIRTPNVGRGRLILEGANRVNEATYRAWTKRATPKAGDIIIAREAPVGNVALITQGQVVCLGQRTVLVRPDRQKVDSAYLTYFLLGDYAQNSFRSTSIGSTVAHLNMADIRALKLPRLPSPTMQTKIAGVLSAYDDLIEVNQRRIAILEEMARRLFDEWFVRFRFPGHEATEFVESEVGRSPRLWQQTKVGELLRLNYGRALRSDQRRPGGVPVFGSSGVVGEHDVAMVRGPGIIVGRKGNVGAVHWSSNDFYPIDTVFYIETSLPLRWVFQLLKKQTFLNSDAAVPGLNREQALAMKVIRPTFELVDKYSRLTEPLNCEAEILSRQNTRLRAARDLLLPKLISGEIDVSRAETAFAEAAE